MSGRQVSVELGVHLVSEEVGYPVAHWLRGQRRVCALRQLCLFRRELPLEHV